jgi:hypothetical protein
MPKLPRRHFFDTWGEKGNGIAYTDNTHWWKIINGKIVDFTNSYEGTKEWKREFVARQKQGVTEGEVIRPDFSRGKSVENPNITAPRGYDRFEVDGKKIIGIKNSKKAVVSTTSDERLARELVMIYNGGKASTELKPISMLQAFGSKQLVDSEKMGIKLAEKPGHWDDFEEYGFAAKNNFNEIKLKKLEKAIGKLKTYRGVDIYGKTTFGDKPRGPLARTIFMPPEDMFIVKFDDGTRYVVDKTGAMTYIRNWQKINDITDIKEQGVAEAKSPQEFMSQITKVDSSILDKKKDSPYYMAGKMLDRHADKLGRDDMDFADFKRHAALLMGSPEDNMKSAKQVRNLDTAARDVILDNVWEYSATQKDADTYYKVSGFRRIR